MPIFVMKKLVNWLPAAFLAPALLLGWASAANAEPPRVTVVVGELLPEEQAAPAANPRKPSLLKRPFGVDFDRAGNMTIVELEGGRVFRLTAAGVFSQIAGDGATNYAGDGGPASEAKFNGMHNVAVTPSGDIYIADSWNHCIRKIDGETNTITTFAGTGKPGFSGDGGPALQASFDFIMCITLNAAHDTLYVADLKNRRVRKIDLKTTLVSTIAGNGQKGVPKDGAVAVEAPLVDPRAVAADSQENVYILERGGNALRRLTPDGRIETVAGTGRRGDHDGPALQAEFGSPKHICVDADDNVLIADDQNGLVRLFDPRKKTVTSVLGRKQNRPSIALLNPHGVCYQRGRLYVVDSGHHRILQMPWPGRKTKPSADGS